MIYFKILCCCLPDYANWFIRTSYGKRKVKTIEKMKFRNGSNRINIITTRIPKNPICRKRSPISGGSIDDNTCEPSSGGTGIKLKTVRKIFNVIPV
jgi:hypothetical protein